MTGRIERDQRSHDTTRMMLYDADKKSVLVAYILWFVLGYLGGHRFYTGRVVSGILMLLITAMSWILTLVYIGFVGLFLIFLWWILDAFLIPGWISGYNRRLAARL